jgi:2'-5' RNA ligase
MSPRLLRSLLATAAAAAALHAGTVHAQADSTKAPFRSSKTVVTNASARKGNLFSAVTFADSAFGAEWARLRVEAQSRFPHLRLTTREDLHITVVYIGGDWTPEVLDEIRAHALVVPAIPVRFTPEVIRLGHNNQVVAVGLHGTSTAWADSVIVAKAALNRLGLKNPEAYDSNFLTHITLAQARHSPPTQADSTGLAGFLAWMGSKLAQNPQKFSVTIGPTTRVRLLLAGTTRPDGAPEYVTVDDFLQHEMTSPPAR